MKSGSDGGFVDLHVHTTYSDGKFSPEEVVRKAIELGLRAIAVTDHDCVNGIPPTIEAARGTELEIVPGVEISAAKNETEIHILGYFINWQDPFLLEIFRKMRENRAERMKKMIHLLHLRGIDIDADKVFAAVSEGTAGRLHLARVMTEENITRDEQEAFDRYIGDGKPCHVRHKRLDYRKAIDIIRKAGGVPVLAHPGTMGRDEHIPSYVQAGLRGIEVFHSDHQPLASDKYLALAKEYGLIMTGGSDCHGIKKGRVLIGKVKVGYEVVENLRREAEKVRLSLPSQG
jgi:predicted metal-dependent phosphoesterase TrpH